MKKKLLKDTAALAAAAGVLFTQVISACALDISGYEDYDDDELVRVIVSLKEDPVMEGENACEEGTGYLETEEAEIITEKLIDSQERAADAIRAIYPEMTVSRSYTTLMNGFSCDIPFELIDDVEAIPMIESVYINHSHMSAQMYTAADECGVPAFRNETGYTGEGEVVAVIDSELDITNDMFAPLEGKKVKLTKKDIQKVKDSKAGFSTEFEIDVDKAYVSSKLPFVVWYGNLEEPYNTANENEYHGTHVSGIAAGNEVTSGGMTLSGVAPDAQIVFMCCSDPIIPGFISDEYIIAAIEDAVKLNVSSINISLGYDSEFGNEIYDDIFERAEKAGIVICVSAGNDSKPTRSPDNPDLSTVSSPSTLKGAFSVAAANNAYRVVGSMKLSDGSKINYIDGCNKKLSDTAGGKTVEYVFCGGGSEEELEEKDISGKIVLIDYDMFIGFEYEIAVNAQEAGALGVIAVEEAGDELYEPFVVNPVVIEEPEECVPYVNVVREDGQKLIDAEDKRITVSSENELVPAQKGVCAFSSTGVPQNLDLKPEITAVGGNVNSAGYDNSINALSGTSMSSPFIAGCSALVSQYISEKMPEIKGREKSLMIRNIIMNTAVPFEEDGVYVSPRRQGAGLADMSKIPDAKVIMTGTDGLGKICVNNITSDSFEFEVTVKNISDRAVSFKNASLDLTTDSSKVYEGSAVWREGLSYIDGAQKLKASVSGLDGLKTLKAGEEKKVKLTVSLDSAQCSEIKKNFTNGFFVDGFLSLSGASNSSDISVPLLGFYGSWEDLPIFGKTWTEHRTNEGFSFFMTNVGDYCMALDVSLSRLCKMKKSYKLTSTKDREKDRNKDKSDEGELSQREKNLKYELCMFDPRMKDLSAEDMKGVINDKLYISPNSDGMGDKFMYNYFPLRDAYVSGIEVYDLNGNKVVDAAEHDMIVESVPGMTYTYQLSADILDDLPDGTYEGVMTGYIPTDEAQAHKQTIRQKFDIDRVPPEISDIKIESIDNRVVLSFKAKDDNLDGIYVMGNGYGCVYDENDKDPYMNGYTFSVLSTVLNEFSNTYYMERQYDEEDHRLSLQSTVFRDLVNALETEELSDMDIDLFDIVPCEPDKDGCFEFRYDITELEEYSICVVDKAFNMADYGDGIGNVGHLLPLDEVEEGDTLTLQPPQIKCDDPIVKQGWQISLDSINWKEFDPEQQIGIKYDRALIRYYVKTDKNTTYSNPVIIYVKGADNNRCKITVTNGYGVQDAYYTVDDSFELELDRECYYFIEIAKKGYVTKYIEEYLELTDEEKDALDKAYETDDFSDVDEIQTVMYHLDLLLARPGDVDINGKVDISDAVAVIADINGTKALEDYSWEVADADCSGAVDIEDAVLIINQINGVKAIPDPVC